MLNICDVDDDRCRIVEWDGRGNHDCVRCADRAFKHGQKVTRSESKTWSESKTRSESKTWSENKTWSETLLSCPEPSLSDSFSLFSVFETHI